MNALQKALTIAGLAKEPKPRRKRKKATKEIKCRKCYKPENTNVATCECGNYIIFDGR